MACKKIAFFNGKGGCGKTTSLFHVAGVLAEKGEKVLVSDLDKQRNSTRKFLSAEESNYSNSSSTIYDVMKGRETFEDVVKKSFFVGYRERNPKYRNIDVLPSDIRLQDESLLHNIDIEDSFNKFVKEQGYTYVLIDMPPSNKKLNEICLQQMADYVIVPFSSDEFSVDGYDDLLNSITEAREVNDKLQVIGIYLSRYMNCNLDDYIKSQLQASFGDMFIDVQIPLTADIKDSLFLGKPISYYKRFSPSKSAYEKLVREIERRIDALN